jgi:shikimate dehydrogenase
MGEVSARTQLAAVIGAPIRHSLSPTLHNAAFRATGLDWVYTAFEVADGMAVPALDSMRTLGIRGYSVTMPHKTAVAAAVDELTDAARELQAVNCVVNRDGWLIGDNTDGAGFIDAFRHDTGEAVTGRRVGVIGAGGAARAVCRAVARAGAHEVVVVNRSPDAARTAAALAGPAGRAGALADLAGCDVLVNATPRGMKGPLDGALATPPEALREGQIVVDLVYDPRVTPWLTAAREIGLQVHGGASMLVFQAAHAFTKWTGEAAPIEAMLAAISVA